MIESGFENKSVRGSSGILVQQGLGMLLLCPASGPGPHLWDLTAPPVPLLPRAVQCWSVAASLVRHCEHSAGTWKLCVSPAWGLSLSCLWAARQHRCDTVRLHPSAGYHWEQRAAVAIPVQERGQRGTLGQALRWVNCTRAELRAAVPPCALLL